jgi:hypothetical protein
LRVIDANKCENDMLLKDQMNELSKEHMAILARDGKELKVTWVETSLRRMLSHPDGAKESVVSLCGQTLMIKVAVNNPFFVFINLLLGRSA